MARFTTSWTLANWMNCSQPRELHAVAQNTWVLPYVPLSCLFAFRCYGLGRVLASACIRSVLLLTLSM